MTTSRMINENMTVTPLGEKEWEPFNVFESGILSIKTTGSGVDGIRIKSGNDENVPYITRSDTNNGIARFVSETNYEYGFDEGGCIIVGLDTQTAFWQPGRFITGQNIHIITADWLNMESAMFLIPLLRSQMRAKFNWGGNGATLKRMRKLAIMLPVTGSGEPDYTYMADYVRQRRMTMLEKYRAYAEKRITALGDSATIPALEEKEWHTFAVNQVFLSIQRGKRLKNADHIPGCMPYVSSTALNNGVADWIDATEGTRVFEDCISLANSGSVGSAFYEPFAFVASDHITHLKRPDTNGYIYLFLACALEKQKANFNFSREINDSRINKLHIMLPVNDANEPDYKYMEQYARNMMILKLRQYLTFIESKA